MAIVIMKNNPLNRFIFGLICCLCVFARSSTAWAEHKIYHARDIIWASPKGFNLTLDIAIPSLKTKGKPVLVIFHGGGWILNNKSIMSDLADQIASRADIITVNVNYRLLPDLNNTTTVNEIIEDGMGAVLWVKDNIKKYGGNPHKIAITGDSAGGHIASLVALAGRNLSSTGFSQKPFGFKPTYLPKGKSAEQIAKEDGLKVYATILSYTGFSLTGMALGGFESADNPFWKYANATPRGFFGGTINVKDHPEYYQAMSPNYYPVDIKTYQLGPQFVHVGDKDTLTPADRAQAYVAQLQGLGQNVRIKIYPNKKHGYLDSGCNDYNQGCFNQLSEPAVSDMLDFLNEVFKLKIRIK